MVKLETPVRCANDQNFVRLEELLQLHHSMYTDQIVNELKHLLSEVPTYVRNWQSQAIGNNTYRLYGKKTPAIEATQNFITTIRTTIPSSQRQEKKAVDVQKIQNSHVDWLPAQQSTSNALSRKVKEPEILLFFKK